MNLHIFGNDLIQFEHKSFWIPTANFYIRFKPFHLNEKSIKQLFGASWVFKQFKSICRNSFFYPNG